MAKTVKEGHWRDRAITSSEAVSDGFEVVKAWGARIAEWVLFICLLANILQMFKLGFPDWFGTTVLAVQAITLDIAGFGLTSMGKHARARGDEKAAKTAARTGWTLITLMVFTVSLIAMSHLFPKTQGFVAQADNVMILARLVVSVFYGHIVHSLRQASTEHEKRVSTLEKEVSSLRVQLSTKEQEVSSGQAKMDSLRGQLRVSTEEVSTLKKQLDSAEKRVSTLEKELDSGQGDTTQMVRELNTLKIETEGLRATLEAKVRLATAGLQEELDSKKRELESVQQALSTEQKMVSSLQRQLSTVQREVSTKATVHSATGQQKVSSVHRPEVSSGQAKVVQLDTRRRPGQDDIAEKIQEMIQENSEIKDREIARRLNISPTTVGKHRTAIEERKEKEA